MTYPYSRSTYSDIAGGDTAVHSLISDEQFLGAIVEFEKALATAAFDCGYLTESEHAAAVSAIDTYELDVEEISQLSAAGANPAIPIAKQLKALAGEAGIKGIHTGATSQDAIDTALVLVFKRGVAELIDATSHTMRILAGLSELFADTPAVGRTLGQAAQPMTFGLIAANWLEVLHDACQEVERASALLPVQYGGATGTLAATHPYGVKIHDKLANILKLESHPRVWHTNRVPFARLASSLAVLAGAIRKIAGDIVFMSATEVGELREATPGGSSSMPHKANPAAAIAADGYARRAPGLANTMLEAMDSRMQRGTGSWHAEWASLRELVAVTASAQARLFASLDGIGINKEAMENNLLDTGTVGHAQELIQDILNRAESLQDPHREDDCSYCTPWPDAVRDSKKFIKE
ncbi:lyase family protein [Corynebacterium sp. J010B-136]|uniref:lyase family protein n=1 Tax=Corynebacterium sp. J010B-136 TaxID=2099401 RepID=UPI000CF92902|nr:lyase family protein [Corynebacterium sp. J010B-136]PQM75407.1 3-carboxy-cis,cis-muconate cycloisomerase [Corynebacterium sp. J010B-136]